ncbi:MAG: enoyl-CoA hydratase/isomerase family protein [Propionicimonas sp.]|uniref:enoyl-CoA hydratase/isomerase family protein n=1 Tax=Propionicimonas sp. TaxID=1955623 RepID=UPI002B209383|nr:enoyl-CoA hydratase/isomerase family protein [Propionicimonas sp.]MEA4945198.1 enoyl-CoA hydratase/isomerase family protein [Propionicimonas sp.]MEA5052852.1 enoyl-CoA hydratase/isomerase family protein [Propionicimonas sp.]MEA5118480.1 enoyl-CoA hydratase/isomerase family protein [Propionicimonas sp.]
MSEPEVLVDVVAGVGRIRLNRPRAINALSYAMLQTIRRVLDDFAVDPEVERVELTGAGERGLCAGADVRALRAVIGDGSDPAEFLGFEYALNLAIAEFPKTYTAVMDGITMGGGMGLSVHGSDRVVTPTSQLAMPETQIGLYPDVLVTWYFSRMPAEVGTHLALTGTAVNAADALWLGLADRVVGTLPSPVLAVDHDWITECYAGDDPVAILERLSRHPQPQAHQAAETLRARSPLAVHVALAALRRAAGLTLAEVAAQDLVACSALARHPDFAEGVRAQLVDRDRTPHWTHASLDEVTPAEVAAIFTA